jgi:hypothetical protein
MKTRRAMVTGTTDCPAGRASRAAAHPGALPRPLPCQGSGGKVRWRPMPPHDACTSRAGNRGGSLCLLDTAQPYECCAGWLS